MTELALRMPVQILRPVAGDDLDGEAREVKLSSNPERPPLVKIVYAHSRTAAWVSVERIVDYADQARLTDVAHGARQCARCGCTDNVACGLGCSWAQADPFICSECV